MKLGIKGFFLFFIVTIIALSQEFPQPTGYVNDFARILSPATIGILDERIEALRQKNSVEIAVVTIQSTGELPLEDYANLLFQKWGIGQKGADNGVLLLVAVGDRKVRIEPGYGLEPILPDGLCGEIIRTRILPEFRKGDFNAGILAGVQAIEDVVLNKYTEGKPAGGKAIQIVPIGFFVLLLLLILFIRLSRRGILPYTIFIPAGRKGYRRGGFWSGGSFGGGGFGGGFGGFGGGSSGGGGASGSW